MTISDIIFAPINIIKSIYAFFWRIFFQKMPLDEFDDYEHYWNKRKNLPLKYRYKYIASQLPDKGRVLDVGCGDGTFLRYLKTQKPELEIMGIDISESTISKLKEDGIEGIVCDLDLAEKKLFPNCQADYVVVMELIEHLPNPEVLMKNLRQLQAQCYYVTIPNLGFIENRLRLALGGKMPITRIIFHIKEHLRFWTVSDFKYWANHVGYRVVNYHGQNGTWFLWRIWPALFAKQMIYLMEADNNK